MIYLTDLIFIFIAQIGKYIHLRPILDKDTDVWVDVLVYLPDSDSQDGVYLEKPKEIEWYELNEFTTEYPVSDMVIQEQFENYRKIT